MDKLSNRLRLVRSQSMGVGMAATGDKIGMAAAAARRNVQAAAQAAHDGVGGGGGAPAGGHQASSDHQQQSVAGAGRNASIILLDERRLELHLQPRMFAGELLDLVAAHCQLREKEFFGLAVVDENGHYQWLQLDRKVLDHDLPRKPATLTVHFLVKFFIESISHLSENRTVELFYLQARSLIFRGTLEVDSDIVFQLAALALQASFGDFVDDPTTRNLVKKSPILPASVLKEHASLTLCEDRVIENYQKTRGQTRGQAVVNYMTIVESMPTYGVHYFEVYDKRQTPWWLGLSCRGIAQYGYNDRKVPVRVFQWKQLENLYFRDKKFSIEVHDAKRVVQTVSSFNLYDDAIKSGGDRSEQPSAEQSGNAQPMAASGGGGGGGAEKKDELVDAIADSTTQVSVSRRSFNPGSIHVYVWFGKTQSLTKCIWQSAISQHQFYLDRKQAKMRHVPVRTLKEIARDLTRSSASLSSRSSSMSNLSRSGSTHSLAVSGSGLSVETDPEQSEETRRARMEMLQALKARREALVAKLEEKNKILKELCIKEGELTGELPPEIPLAPGEPVPAIRRRVGTEFALPENLLSKPIQSPEDEMVAKLELEFEIQSKITSAALKIASDSHAAKSVRKQRKVSYHQNQRKLREIETNLNTLKHMRAQRRKRGGEHHRATTNSAARSPERGKAEGSATSRRMGGGGGGSSSVAAVAAAAAAVPDLDASLDSADQVDGSGGGAAPRSCPSSPRKPSHLAAAADINMATSKLHHTKPDSVSLEASPRRVQRSSGYVPSSVYLRSASYRGGGNHSKQYHAAINASAAAAAAAAAGHHGDVGLPLSPEGAAAVMGSTRSATLPSPYRNKYEVPNIQVDSPVGLYNCPQQRTSQAFSSMDDLDALNSVHLHPGYPPTINLSPQPALTGAGVPPLRGSPAAASGGAAAAGAHRLTPTRSNFVNQHLLSHREVLSQAQAVISRAEAATAAAISTQKQHMQPAGGGSFPGSKLTSSSTLERSNSNMSSVRHNKMALQQQQLLQPGTNAVVSKMSSRELPALPSSSSSSSPAASSKSMEDLDALEALGVHGRSKMLYREVTENTANHIMPNGPSLAADGLTRLSSASSLATTARSHHLPNTEEYPTHHHPSSSSNIHRPIAGYDHHSQAAAAGSSSSSLRGLAGISGAPSVGPHPVSSHHDHTGGGRPPYPSALSNHSSTLLPGQTYPEHSVPKYPGINTLQEVFLHRQMRLEAAAAAAAATSVITSSSSSRSSGSFVTSMTSLPGAVSNSAGGHNPSDAMAASKQQVPAPPPPPPPPPPKAKDKSKAGEESPPPPPLYPKQYHQVVEQRRRSGLDRPTATAVAPKQVTGSSSSNLKQPSPLVDRKIKPVNPAAADQNQDQVDAGQCNGGGDNSHGSSSSSSKFFKETTKPFEMSDFYKYSTKYRKSSLSSLATNSKSDSSSSNEGHPPTCSELNGLPTASTAAANHAATSTEMDSDSSPRSSTASGTSLGPSPPELPARPLGGSIGSCGGSPIKAPPPPPPPKSEKLSNNFVAGNNNVHHSTDSLADSFCSEMLDWYNTQKTAAAAAATKSAGGATATGAAAPVSNNSSTAAASSAAGGGDSSNKPATLV